MRQAHVYFQVSGSSIRLLAMEHSKTPAMPHGYTTSVTVTL